MEAFLSMPAHREGVLDFTKIRFDILDILSTNHIVSTNYNPAGIVQKLGKA
jgi:hypothetical protein